MNDHGEDWWDRRLAAESASREPTEFRRDGWPLCPNCGDDELYSLATPPRADAIDGCYRCGPAHPLAKPAPYRRRRVGSARPLRLVRRDNSG